jgi:outer membrane protein OmpA-like peptidoglycan-associated protein
VKLVGLRDNVVVAFIQENNGAYEFSIRETAAKDYRLSVEKDGYVFQNINVKIEGASTQPKTVTRTVQMRRVSVGVVSILRNIYFDFGKATFRQESYNELNKLEAMLRQNASMKVEIAGHTDNYGSKTFNKQLSLLRAQAVRSFLTSKGIDPRRVSAVGYGEERPLASNDDDKEGRELNRRVEFKVLEN